MGTAARYCGGNSLARTKRDWHWGVTPPAEWVSTGADASRVIQELREEFIHITAEYLPGICKGLREYQLTVLQSLEAGDDTYQAVHSLWDGAVDFSEPDSEKEEEEEAVLISDVRRKKL